MKTRLPFGNTVCAALCALLITSTTPAATFYVWQGSPRPTPPFAEWATAAHTIQEAVDAANTGDLILVTNGVYQTGARAVSGMSNRVAVTKPVTARSVNGPDVTRIVGYQVPGTRNGPAAVRCVYLTSGAVLAGFTLTHGATQTSGDSYRNQSGGGVRCEGLSAVVSNCTLTGNSAGYAGGGASAGTLNNCTLTDNLADLYGGGVAMGNVSNCTVTRNTAIYGGGGAAWASLNNSVLSNNLAGGSGGGGAYISSVNNCTLVGNRAIVGGGAIMSDVNNCTLVGNWAGGGGGAFDSTLRNCIVYYNTADPPFGCELSQRHSLLLLRHTLSLGGGQFHYRPPVR